MVSLIHMVFNFIWNFTILYLYSFEILSEHESFCILDRVRYIQKMLHQGVLCISAYGGVVQTEDYTRLVLFCFTTGFLGD